MTPIEFSAPEKALLGWFVDTGHAVESLFATFPDHRDQLDELMASIASKLEKAAFEDVWLTLMRLHKVGEERIALVRKQRYEEAARIRDMERTIEEELLHFKRQPYKDKFDLLTELQSMDKEINDRSQLCLYITPGTATPNQVGSLLHELSKLYMMLGGSGIQFKPDEVLMHKEELV